MPMSLAVQCTWTPIGMLSQTTLFKPPFPLPKNLYRSIANFSPPLMATMSTASALTEAVSTQDESTQKTHRPLQVAKRLEKFKTTIFTQMSMLAIKHGAVNLGQGFPNFDCPEFIKEAAIEAIKSGQNQYARGYGVPDFNSAIAERFKKDTGLVVDPEKEVTVTSGCTEAIAATMLGLINPGDEVILFAPFYSTILMKLLFRWLLLKSNASH